VFPQYTRVECRLRYPFVGAVFECNLVRNMVTHEILPFFKHEEYRSYYHKKSNDIIPPQTFLEIEDREKGKHNKANTIRVITSWIIFNCAAEN